MMNQIFRNINRIIWVVSEHSDSVKHLPGLQLLLLTGALHLLVVVPLALVGLLRLGRVYILKHISQQVQLLVRQFNLLGEVEVFYLFTQANIFFNNLCLVGVLKQLFEAVL